jgi:6-phosphofructo-2-kinase/fructose-2,6-biphosphatase 4
MAAPLYTTQSGRLWHAGLILMVTVGLPGGPFVVALIV